MKSTLSESAKRTFVQGRIGAANAAEFFAVLKNVRAGADVVRLLAARPGTETAALLPATLDALYGLIYALQAACVDARTTSRVLEIIEQFSEMRGDMLPVREAQTLAVELICSESLVAGLEAAVVASPAYRRHVETRPQDHRYA